MENKKLFISQQAKLIRQARKHAKFTQKEIGDKLGVSQDTISMYERGKASMPSYHILQFSRYCKKPVTYFFMTDI